MSRMRACRSEARDVYISDSPSLVHWDTMLAGRGCSDMANAGRSHVRLARSGMEERMGDLTRWWRGRRLAPRQQRHQEGQPLYGRHLAASGDHRGVAYPRRGSSVWSRAQPTADTHAIALLGERYDDNIFTTQTNKQHDFITVLSPGIRAQYLSPGANPEGRNLISLSRRY